MIDDIETRTSETFAKRQPVKTWKTWRTTTSAAVGGCKRGCRQGSGIVPAYLTPAQPARRGEFGCVFSLDCRTGHTTVDCRCVTENAILRLARATNMAGERASEEACATGLS